MIPKELISIFNEQELELLISGLPTIDIDDLKANTEYHKYTEGSLQVPYWMSVGVNMYRSCWVGTTSIHGGCQIDNLVSWLGQLEGLLTQETYNVQACA